MSSNDLEQRVLHKALVSLNAPARWPGWLIGCAALVPIAGVAGLWWLVIEDKSALYLAIILATFTLADALALVGLRHWRISFGPVGSQLLALEFPRLIAALLATLVAAWLGSMAALAGLVVINLCAWLALVWAGFIEPRRLGLSRLSITGDSLPSSLSPLRMLHISDLHVERFGRREEQLLETVREIAPDLIVLTGDYLNLSYVDDPVAHDHARRVLRALAVDSGNSATHGIFAVLGSPPVDRKSAALFDGLPIRLLRDEAVTLDLTTPPDSPLGPREQGARLTLLGLDCSHDPDRDARRLAAVAAQVPSDVFRVLLYHSPELMLVAPEFDINLYVCGHTHGGQVRLPFYGALVTSSRLGKRFEMGYYRLADTHLYVSRGIGLEGLGAPRVRLLCSPEISLFSIQGPEDGQENDQ